MSCCIGASPLIGSILSFEGVMTATIGNTVDAGVAGVSRPLRLSTDSDEGSEISGLAGDRAGLSGKGIYEGIGIGGYEAVVRRCGLIALFERERRLCDGCESPRLFAPMFGVKRDNAFSRLRMYLSLCLSSVSRSSMTFMCQLAIEDAVSTDKSDSLSILTRWTNFNSASILCCVLNADGLVLPPGVGAVCGAWPKRRLLVPDHEEREVSERCAEDSPCDKD